ncbi:hypothetical protein FSP39_015217 [Pinctada imbricata]|uniref:Uncharacterized protein n=1 Tax=Pinctada imbricata TaxID=66713 RepID=A0AA88Y7M5_PINIB|nr:hypothetical protein FSP39_015217 [Pinctada imbricata]
MAGTLHMGSDALRDDSKRNSTSPHHIHLVAAIDFGTTFSGIAWQYCVEFQQSPLQIQTKRWIGCDRTGFISEKTPTALLLNSKKEFKAFGGEAETIYADLADENAHHGYYFFRHFKMMLYKETLTKDTMLTDDQGHKVEAKVVFEHCIRYLKGVLVEELDKSGNLVQENEIFWVLTVPAIWNEAAKQFMRMAATSAGIPNKRLSLALEPEAAAIHAKENFTQRLPGSIHIQRYSPGTKYMVLDLGGGTVDVTVREVLEDRSLKELHKASGNDWGGLTVNSTFLDFFEKLLGTKVMEELRSMKPVFLDLEREIELKKRSTGKDGRVLLVLPGELFEIYKKIHGKDLTNSVAYETRYAGLLDIKRGKMRVESSIIQEFFKPAIDRILEHTSKVLEKMKGVREIILVGGFAECHLVSDAIQDAFSDHRVLAPNDKSLAVLKGAVLFGQDPTGSVKTRMCNATYGISVMRFFLEGYDDEKKKDMNKGTPFCKDVFEPLAKIGQTFDVGDTVQTDVEPYKADMTKMSVRLYKSQSEDPKYVTDSDCVLLGKMTVDMPDTSRGLNRKVEVSLTFGDVELKCRGKDCSTGKIVETSLDLL